MAAPGLWVYDKSPELSVVCQVESLGDDITQVFIVKFTVAVGLEL
jgi:hypothetical protein